jgi:urease accessory protein UreF
MVVEPAAEACRQECQWYKGETEQEQRNFAVVVAVVAARQNCSSEEAGGHWEWSSTEGIVVFGPGRLQFVEEVEKRNRTLGMKSAIFVRVLLEGQGRLVEFDSARVE